MNKINLKIQNDNLDIITLIKLMNTIKAKMNYNHIMHTIQFVGETDIYSAIEKVIENYSIEEIEIDNTDYVSKDTTEVISQNSTSSEQLNLDDKIESHLSKIREICYSYLEKDVSADELVKHILTCYSNIALANSILKKEYLKIGDIVQCNFGQNLPNEVSGDYVYSIIIKLDFKANLAFVSPIVKTIKSNEISKNVIPILSEDFSTTENFKAGYILLERSCYVSLKRIRKTIGTLSNSIFNEIIEQLPEAFFFDPILEQPTVVEKKITKPTKPKETFSQTDWLKKNLATELASISLQSNYDDELDKFFTNINLPTNSYLKQAFLVSKDLNKIKSKDVLNAMISTYELKVSSQVLLHKLNNEYREWLNKNYPEFLIQFKNPSIFLLIKLYKSTFF